MNKLHEMIKRRKDQGFTLIELMIVIAVIGILAIVLVPKFGNIKTSAKDTGVTTNFRSVTASVHAVKLGKTENSGQLIADKVKARLDKDFDTTGTNALVNPYTKEDTILTTVSNAAVIVMDSEDTDFVVPTPTGEEEEYIGTIVVAGSVNATTGVPTVTVYGCDDKGNLIEGLTEVIEP